MQPQPPLAAYMFRCVDIKWLRSVSITRKALKGCIVSALKNSDHDIGLFAATLVYTNEKKENNVAALRKIVIDPVCLAYSADLTDKKLFKRGQAARSSAECQRRPILPQVWSSS
ncbi:hypothetical protein Tco_0826787 [Tanacetum coccineum]